MKLKGRVGEQTFGIDRYLNQYFYKRDPDWLAVRPRVIARDLGCDLGVEGFDIAGPVIIHHMNPLTEHDILCKTEFLLDMEYLICVSPKTHRAVHYGDKSMLPQVPVVRKPNDTCPWRK